jgi:hypothetical protein
LRGILAMATNPIIATVSSITGTAFARGEDGQLRELKAGDALFLGETLSTGDGSCATLVMIDGAHFLVAANHDVALGGQFPAGRELLARQSALPDSGGAGEDGEAATGSWLAQSADLPEQPAAEDDVARVLRAIEQGEDIDQDLEAAAAGLGGGAGAQGHDFVRVARVRESTSPIPLEFDTTDRHGSTGDQ